MKTPVIKLVGLDNLFFLYLHHKKPFVAVTAPGAVSIGKSSRVGRLQRPRFIRSRFCRSLILHILFNHTIVYIIIYNYK